MDTDGNCYVCPENTYNSQFNSSCRNCGRNMVSGPVVTSREQCGKDTD